MKDAGFTAEGKVHVPVGSRRGKITAFITNRGAISTGTRQSFYEVNGSQRGISNKYLPEKYNVDSDLVLTIPEDNATCQHDFILEK